jgi:hypothetical protein
MGQSEDSDEGGRKVKIGYVLIMLLTAQKEMFWLNECVSKQVKVSPSLGCEAVWAPHTRSRWCECCHRVNPKEGSEEGREKESNRQ